MTTESTVHQADFHVGVGQMLWRKLLEVRYSFASLVLLIASAYPQTSARQPQGDSSASMPKGVVVEGLNENSSAQRAGMQPGDVLLSWTCGTQKGEIESPFHLTYVVFEQAPRGVLRIEGLRGAQKKVWNLRFLPWGIDTRPNISGSLLHTYLEAEILAHAGKIPEAMAAWRAAAAMGQAPGPSWLPTWFLSHGGESLFRAKQMEASDELYRAAVERAPESSHIVRGEILRQWATALAMREELFNAEKYYRQELLEWQQLSAHVLVAQSLNALGALFLNQGDWNKAESYFIQSSAISEKHAPVDWQRAASYTGLAVLYQREGDLGKAERYYRFSLAIQKKNFARSTALAQTLNDLGILELWRGNLRAAEEYHQEALVIAERLNQPPMIADILDSISDCRLERGDLAGAEEYQERSLALREQAPGSSPVAYSLSSLGKIARVRQNFDQAEQYYRRALEIADKLPFLPLDRASFLAGLGDVARDRGNLPDAELDYRQALAITDQLAPRSLDHAETLASLGAVLYRRGRWDEAADSYSQSLQDLEYQAGNVGSLNENQARFRAKHVRYYREYIGVLIEKGQAELAFETLESSRSRTLFEMLAQAQINIHQGVEAALLARESDVRRLLNAKMQHRMSLLSEQHSDAQMDGLDREIASLRASYDEVESDIRTKSPGYASLVQPQALSLMSIQRLLDADTVLLEYSLGEERSHVWVVTAKSLNARPLPKRAVLERSAQKLYLTLTSRTRNKKPDAKTQVSNWAKEDALARRLASDLSQTILAPVADLIKGRPRLLIVAEGALQYIPFAVLPSPEKPSVPLLVEHEIVNLPSASVLAEIRQASESRSKVPREVAVFADPVFYSDDDRVTGVPKNKSRVEFTESRRQLSRSASDVGFGLKGGHYLPRLMYTREEATAILSVVPHARALRALDFQANRTIALNPSLGHYRIVHFATHGFLDSKRPELSGLVLSLVDPQGEPQDGFIGLADIYNLKLPVDLVVLSGCQTGLGEEVSGEGLIGLTRGFMYAGASRVVASLWNVSDMATSNLMADFYKAMERDGMRPAAALRVAQIKMWKQQRWSSPYYWAAFQIQGEWR